ncbi:MAG: carbohydrate binding domain-containing protein [Monoglobaceae bacterium]
MKGICKRVVSCFSAVTMLAAAFGTMAVTASEPQGPAPEVSWSESGETYPRTAQLGISYLNGSAYNGQYSLTALYNDSDKLVGIGSGQLDANGAANYPISIAEAGAANVKCFIWNDSASIKPVTPVYETTYEKFTNLKPLVILNSFENGLFRIFQNNGSYKVEISEDEAHTGTKSAKVSGRTAENTTLRVKVPRNEIGENTKFTVSAFMKKGENVTENVEFYIRVLFAGASGVQVYSEPVAATDNNWYEVKTEVDLSAVDAKAAGKDCVIELNARTGSVGNYNYKVDYYADDFSIICPGAEIPSELDDAKMGTLKWSFDDKNDTDWIADSNTLIQMRDTNKWATLLFGQQLSVESAESGKALAVKETNESGKNAHISTKIKLSRLDLVPGKTYQLSFRAKSAGQTENEQRALYVGLVGHQDSEIPEAFYSGSRPSDYPASAENGMNRIAAGIINYDGDYTVNRAAVLSTDWQDYTYKFTVGSNFNSDGFTDLCFVMTYNKTTDNSWNYADVQKDETLYLDEIEIKEDTTEPTSDVPIFNVDSTALGLRNSFESGLFQIFQNNGSYKVELAEDEAHTGTKSAKVSGRTAENTTLRVKVPRADIGENKTINVSAFMKKAASVTSDAEFYIHTIVLNSAADGTHYNIYTDPVAVTDNNWHEVSMTIDLSAVPKQTGDCVIELGARTGSEGSYNYNVDYYADDFTVVCPNAKQPSVFDDTKVDRLKWDFENGATADWVTVNRTMAQMKDTNKWTRVLNAQTLKIESTSAAEFCNTVSSTTDTSVNTPDADAVTTPPEGSTQMLTTETDSTADNKNAHVTARIKLSRLDLIPNKTYQISFWAFGNSKPRALYIGLVEHSDIIENPSSFNGGNTALAGGIIDYKGDYTINRAAIMPRSWHKYTYTITPAESSFNSDGYTDLCFVMTGDKTLSGSTYDSKDMLKGEKLYLDEIEITESSSSQVAAIANDGLYTKRATFESDNMDMFSPQTRSSVVLTTAAANTGSYSAEFANRKDNWTSLGSSLKGADLSSKITASCYLKKNSLRA